MQSNVDLPNWLTDIVDVAASPARDQVLNAVTQIDSIHRNHPLPALPIRRLPVYFPTLPSGVAGRLIYTKYGLLTCFVEIDGSNSRAGLTTAHEMGHLLDMVRLGNRESLCGTDERFERWRAAILGTEESERLDALAYDESVRIPEAYRSVAELDRFRTHARYLLLWKELWARSYAQYVVVKSADSVLRGQLLRELRSDKWALYYHQWTEESFGPVFHTMDDLFEGWE